MAMHGNNEDIKSTQEHESEAALLLRLEALEQRVLGRSRMAHREMSDFHSKVDALAKQLSRLEGGSRELREVAQQASSLGVLIHPVNMVSPSVETVALKENILLASRGEIEETSQLLDAAKDLESHVNPSYLQDVPKFAQKLSKMEGTYVGQVADATLIDERAESTRLHYNLAISLISEKFVHWDDQVAALERGIPVGSTNASS